jgi:hypothetical protein
MRRFSNGEGLTDLPALAALTSDHKVASEWVREFCGTFIDALRDEPLGEVPMRHGSSAGFARLSVMQIGNAALSLCAYEPAEAAQAPQTAQFTDYETHEIVVAGAARGVFHSCQSQGGARSAIRSRAWRWNAGDYIVRRPLLDTRHILAVERSTLILQLSRRSDHPKPSEEFRLKDGALVQQVSGDKRASEQVMALAVLGALDHRNAIEPMACFARVLSPDRDGRWEAVRQILSLDTMRGMDLLCSFAGAADDPLARPAQELQAHLLASQPMLRALVSEAV